MPCPFRDRCSCQCEARIVRNAKEVTVTLLVVDAHSSANHEREMGIKVLCHKQKVFVASAVKVSPMQTANHFFQNIDGSSSKSIDRSLQKSVACMVCKDQKFLTSSSIALE